MRPNNDEQLVIATAERLAAGLGADPNHTVAAAAMDAAGAVHQAVNVYHFTGGPCAELVALGIAAAAGAGPLLAMAAAGDGGRGVIPPCGRCRQVMFDLHPDLLVAVPGEDRTVMRPIHHLLPDAYRSPDTAATRLVRFHRRYYDAVRSGDKTMTIRYDDPVVTGPAMFVFEDDPAHRVLCGTVLSVESSRFDRLTDQHARKEGVSDVAQLQAGLRSHYPSIADTAAVDVVTFEVDTTTQTRGSAADA